LEVLILHDFKSFAPEVLILGDFKSLFPEVLILVEFKPWLIKKMQKIEDFLEVLILEGIPGDFAEALILRVLRMKNSNGIRAYMNESSGCL